jgi:hypothetical protein
MAWPNVPFDFGIYPGGAAGGDTGLLTGLADDPEAIVDCLDRLQGSSARLIVRAYDGFQDAGSPLEKTATAPAGYAQYAIAGKRPLDLVLQYRSVSADIAGYLAFIRDRIGLHHEYLYSVQITEEPNFKGGPDVIDGPYPEVLNALVEGVIAAKQILRELGAEYVKVGFNATPTFGAAAAFWSQLKVLATPEFGEALNFVGLDFFPDVFRPAAPDGQAGDIGSSVRGILEAMRNIWLPEANISDSVAIHITEHGWPTGLTRSAERQADVLETVVRDVYALRASLNIERYTLFSLRDVSLSDAEDNLFRYFGITDAQYVSKPAFRRFQVLINELSLPVR